MQTKPRERASTPPYAFSEGGPLRRIEERLGITRHDPFDWVRRSAVALSLAYLPALAFGLVWWLSTGEWPALLTRWSIHTRWLAATPLLFLAEQLVDNQTRAAGEYLVRSELLPPDQNDAYRDAVRSSERLRDSPFVELALLALATAAALAELWGLLALPTAERSIHVGTLSVFRFLLMRWTWRWIVWGFLMYRLAGLRLRLNVLHPDQMGGLRPLMWPSFAFCVLVGAGAAAAAGGFADRMLHEDIRMAVFYPQLAVYVGLAYLLAVAPVCAFSVDLARVRNDGLRRYGAFATRYCNAFWGRWLGSPGEPALGTPDVQSLADLGTSFSTAYDIQVLPVSRTLALAILAASFTPMIPLLLKEIGFSELLDALAGALL